MKQLASDLNSLITNYSQKLQQFSEDDFRAPAEPGKWNKKEELGHLIDSAQNNLRRFIVAQYEEQPHIVYDQDAWVKANYYSFQASIQLIRLWLLLNQQIVQVVMVMTDEMGERTCNTGKGKTEIHSLEWLIEDYITHTLHHLHHILGLSPIPYGDHDVPLA
jgi:hypothetical protein